MTAGEEVVVVLHCTFLGTCNTIQHRAVCNREGTMPVRKVKGGYKYGTKGKVYRGKGAKAKAERQGRAIKASQNRRKKR